MQFAIKLVRSPSSREEEEEKEKIEIALVAIF